MNKDTMVVFFLTVSSPVLVALYMFSIGKAEPRPYSSTLERAGISWVVVTNTFTQLGLEQDKTHKLIEQLSMHSIFKVLLFYRN